MSYSNDTDDGTVTPLTLYSHTPSVQPHPLKRGKYVNK